MKNSSKKILGLLVAILVYFFISYDVIDMPYSNSVSVSEAKGWPSWKDSWSKTSESTFHSKLYGDIPVIHSHKVNFKEYAYNGGTRQTVTITVFPTDDKIWIIQLVNWSKALLIILLGVTIFFTTENSKDEDTAGFLWFILIYTLIHAIVSLWVLEPTYGFSEILILVLFLANCFLPQKE